MRNPSEAQLTQEEIVQGLLPAKQSRWGAQSLPSCNKWQLLSYLVALSGGKTREGQTRLASYAAIQGDVSYMRDGMQPASHGFFHQNEPWVLLEAHNSTLALEDPHAAQPLQTRWPCSPLLSWLGGLCGCYMQPHVQPHHVFFFLSKQRLAKPNQILFLCAP